MPQSAGPVKETISRFARTPKDTGSPEVQIALLTQRITHLSEHLKSAENDHAARRGLQIMVGRRSALLKYLVRTERQRYFDTIGALGLRR